MLRVGKQGGTAFALMLIGGILACNPEGDHGINTEGNSTPTKPIFQRIPPPTPAKYANVGDAIDWLNPYVTVQASGAYIISPQLPRERVRVPIESVLAVLAGLPDAAWPYGRVVAVSYLGPMAVGDGPKAQQNFLYLKREFERNGITVDLWP